MFGFFLFVCLHEYCCHEYFCMYLLLCVPLCIFLLVNTSYLGVKWLYHTALDILVQDCNQLSSTILLSAYIWLSPCRIPWQWTKNSCSSIFSTYISSEFFIIASLEGIKWHAIVIFIFFSLQESSRTSIMGTSLGNTSLGNTSLWPLKFTRPVCLYISFKFIVVDFFLVEMQLTLEQHGFELCRFTYTQVFFPINSNYSIMWSMVG